MSLDIHLLLAMGASYHKMQKGEIIFHEGGYCYYYHQLVSGSVRWVNIDEYGQEHVQSIIEPGECFGELPLFDDRPYAASAIAGEDCLILRLRKDVFRKLMKEDHELHLEMNRILVERIRFKFLMQYSITRHTPEDRIRILLEYFLKEKRHICPHSFQLKLTRQQIADLAGLRVETVIRAIRKMHEDGLLLIENRKIFIPDLPPHHGYLN